MRLPTRRRLTVIALVTMFVVSLPAGLTATLNLACTEAGHERPRAALTDCCCSGQPSASVPASSFAEAWVALAGYHSHHVARVGGALMRAPLNASLSTLASAASCAVPSSLVPHLAVVLLI